VMTGTIKGPVPVLAAYLGAIAGAVGFANVRADGPGAAPPVEVEVGPEPVF
jgi:hypothetical protein